MKGDCHCPTCRANGVSFKPECSHICTKQCAAYIEEHGEDT